MLQEKRLIEPIAHIETALPTKFGLPRQSGLAPSLRARIVFEPLYRDPVAFRGLEGYSHIWLIWGFSENERDSWAATVKPPRLGGNRRMGVFATRSPYRPNALGLSCVELLEMTHDEKLGPALRVYIAGKYKVKSAPVKISEEELKILCEKELLRLCGAACRESAESGADFIGLGKLLRKYEPGYYSLN